MSKIIKTFGAEPNDLKEIEASIAKHKKSNPEMDFSKWMRDAIRQKLRAEKRAIVTLPRVTTNREGLVTHINPAFTEMCGFTLKELRNQKPGAVLQGPGTEKAIVAKFRRAIKQRKEFDGVLTNYRKDKSPYRVRIRMRPTDSGFEADEEVVG